MKVVSRLARGSWPAALAAGLIAAQAAADTGKCFMWQVTTDAGTAYLLGSVHVGIGSMYPLDSAIEDAFRKSDTLVVEVNITPQVEMQAALLTLKRGSYPQGETLEQNLTKETLDKLHKYLASQELSLAAYNNFRPWLLGMTLVMREFLSLGYSQELGIDKHFIRRAGSREVRELESVEKQLNLLSSGDKTVQDLELREMLDQLDSARDTIEGLIRAWQTGDDGAVDRILSEDLSDDPRLTRLHEMLLDDRNVEMTAKIEEYLKEQRTFLVVVGCGHLVGEKGIVNLLKKKHYRVTQVSATGQPGKATSP